MKTLTEHINEALKIGKNISSLSTYSCQPKDKSELEHLIEDRISEFGYECDLNDIDVSLIKDMSYLFHESKFNGDISKWNVSNVTNMGYMFDESSFNGDISRWDVSSVIKMSSMFFKSKFNHDISKWDISKVRDMKWMFCYSDFNKDISKWNISKDVNTYKMFNDCPIKEEYKPVLPE